MTSTPEYASDGTTLVEVIRQLERDGFTGQLSAQPGGVLRCYSCREDSPADEVELRALRRTEGASDPDDMVALAAVACPRCGALGTVALKYGPDGPVDEAEVLRLLDDASRASTGVPVDGDGSAA
jgi:hypothetical protein